MEFIATPPYSTDLAPTNFKLFRLFINAFTDLISALKRSKKEEDYVAE